MKEIKEKVILIRPARLCRENMSEEEIYEMTRGVWRVSKARAQKADYVFCVISGKVIRVYKIEDWYVAGALPYQFRKKEDVIVPGRFEFKGTIDDNLQKKYYGMLIDFPNGASNPVRYINC